MDTSEYETLFRVEENYWWFVGQRALVSRLLRKYSRFYNAKEKMRILDIGSGAGINLQMLSHFGDAHGCDISEDAISFCAKRGLAIKKSDVLDLQYTAESFDVAAEFGVFYHKNVTDDVKAMREVYRVLKKNGRFIMTDSAMMCLYGRHDIAFQGVRRYSATELKRKLESAGFVVEEVFYTNSILFPLIYLHRKIGNLMKSKPSSEVNKDYNKALNWTLKKIYLAEIWATQYVHLPFGVNICAVARKI